MPQSLTLLTSIYQTSKLKAKPSIKTPTKASKTFHAIGFLKIGINIRAEYPRLKKNTKEDVIAPRPKA